MPPNSRLQVLVRVEEFEVPPAFVNWKPGSLRADILPVERLRKLGRAGPRKKAFHWVLHFPLRCNLRCSKVLDLIFRPSQPSNFYVPLCSIAAARRTLSRTYSSLFHNSLLYPLGQGELLDLPLGLDPARLPAPCLLLSLVLVISNFWSLRALSMRFWRCLELS